MLLSSGKVPGLFKHVAALDMDSRVIWYQAQSFFIKEGCFAVISGITSGVRNINYPGILACLDTKQHDSQANTPSSQGHLRPST